MDTAAEQRLTHIDVAKPGNQFLVQQSGFHWCTPVPEQCRQCLSRHRGRKRLHAQMREKAVIVLAGCPHKIDHSEAPGIDKPCPRTAVRLQNQMFVGWRSRIRPCPADREPARHAQVQQHAPPALKTHENILRAPAERENAPAFQLLPQICGKRPSKVRAVDRNMANSMPFKGITKPAHDGFDFWKLWHGWPQRYIGCLMTDSAEHNASPFQSSAQAEDTIDFGYRNVPRGQKKTMVREVFESVAGKYDIMNDVMSLGIHRVWKRIFVGMLNPRPNMKLLDLAGGTGDITFGWLRAGGGPAILSDINAAMLSVGRDRAIKAGLIGKIEVCVVDAEAIPLPDCSVDRVTIAFGLRNCTDKSAVLREARRVLKPGGRFFCLEFSQVEIAALAPIYDLWSFQVLPKMGQIIAKDSESYQYLAESIRMFPDQETLAQMMRDVGLEQVQYRNLSGGIAAIHSGWRL